ncbi:MAG TPA: anti-sigma factor [Motilibacterales bacterium]|nr:anti-sigma factor [Motilibacterales bacterium]
MSHCDETTLALAALGEDIPADEFAHLHSCTLCTTDVAELIEVVTLAREAPAELPEVPDRVWAGIQRELAQAPDGSDSPRSSVRLLPAPTASPEPEIDRPGEGVVVPLERRRTRGPLWSVAAIAAASGALVGGAVVWSAVDRGSSGAGATEQFVAQAVLSPLPDKSVTSPGEATVVDSVDGQVVRVDARALPASEGFYEVWLLDAGLTKLVALGALPAGSVGTFTVPPGMSIADYPVVDISLESYDGDPSHSKNSLMRGELKA